MDPGPDRHGRVNRSPINILRAADNKVQQSRSPRTEVQRKRIGVQAGTGIPAENRPCPGPDGALAVNSQPSMVSDLVSASAGTSGTLIPLLMPSSAKHWPTLPGSESPLPSTRPRRPSQPSRSHSPRPRHQLTSPDGSGTPRATRRRPATGRCRARTFSGISCRPQIIASANVRPEGSVTCPPVESELSTSSPSSTLTFENLTYWLPSTHLVFRTASILWRGLLPAVITRSDGERVIPVVEGRGRGRKYRRRICRQAHGAGSPWNSRPGCPWDNYRCRAWETSRPSPVTPAAAQIDHLHLDRAWVAPGKFEIRLGMMIVEAGTATLFQKSPARPAAAGPTCPDGAPRRSRC